MDMYVHTCVVCVCWVSTIHTCAGQAPGLLCLLPHSPFSTTDRARLTADVRGAPGHAQAHLAAGLGVGGHGGAETLAVSPRVTRTRVAHAGLVVLGGVDLGAEGPGQLSKES